MLAGSAAPPVAASTLAQIAAAGLDRDLLADDRAQQGDIAALADPRLGQADPRERRGEGGLDLAERLQRRFQILPP